MRPGDHERVGALLLAAYDAVGPFTDDYREFLRRPDRWAPGVSEVLVAEDDGEILGAVAVVLPGDDEYEDIRVGTDDGRGPRPVADAGFRFLAVDPQMQGRGVGRALVRACLRECRRRGCRRVVIHSMEFMTAAHRLYRSEGFVRRPDLDVAFPSGVGLAFHRDVTDDASEHFPPPGPVPDQPPTSRNSSHSLLPHRWPAEGRTQMPEEGWYPDPRREADERWWDGSTWTVRTRGSSATEPGSDVDREPDEREKAQHRGEFRPFGLGLPVVVVAVVVTLASVTYGVQALLGEDTGPSASAGQAETRENEPSSCEDLADESIHVIQDVLDEVAGLSMEDIQTMEEPRFVRELEREGERLEGLASALGCSDDQMSSLISRRVHRLEASGPVAELILEAIRQGEVFQ